MKRLDKLFADAGLSLIELVVAMAVFALVAVMGLQSLTGTMRISERLTQIDSETAELGNAITLLRNDLTSVVPMLFYPPQGTPRPAVDMSEDNTVLGLSLAGQKTFATTHTDRHRVEWSVDATQGSLTRRFWPALIPANQNQRSPEMTVLTGVSDLSVRTFWPSVGWVAGTTPPFGSQVIATPVSADQDTPGAPPAAYFSAPPLAIEITLQTARHGNLRLVQTFQ